MLRARPRSCVGPWSVRVRARARARVRARVRVRARARARAARVVQPVAKYGRIFKTSSSHVVPAIAQALFLKVAHDHPHAREAVRGE